jgi:conjugative transfer signal peptidase TraF
MKLPKKCTIGLAIAAIVLAEVGTRAAMKATGLHLNYTASVPVGLYREASKGEAQYAGICLPVGVTNEALHAGLDTIPGECPGGVAPILKPVVEASEAHPIALSDLGFQVDGILIANTAPKPYSRTGKPLTHYPFGAYTKGLWAISKFSADSFDSRYFGPLPDGAIRFYVKPVLVEEEK